MIGLSLQSLDKSALIDVLLMANLQVVLNEFGETMISFVQFIFWTIFQ